MRRDPGEPFGDDADAYTEGPEPVFRANSDEVRTRLDHELAAVRGELCRVDAKTNTLLAVCGVLLGAGVTVLGFQTGVTTAAKTAAAAAGAASPLVTIALVLLLLAVRPHLRGGHGFMHWASADGDEVLDQLSSSAADTNLRRADQLHHLSVLLRAKYGAVRGASTLLLGGLGCGAIAAVLAVWVR